MQRLIKYYSVCVAFLYYHNCFDLSTLFRNFMKNSAAVLIRSLKNAHGTKAYRERFIMLSERKSFLRYFLSELIFDYLII